MKSRRRAVLLAVAATLVLAAACSSAASGSSSSSSSSSPSGGAPLPAKGGPPASVPPGSPTKQIAAVNGVVVTEASFTDELNAIGSVPSFLDATDLKLTPGSIATRLPSGGFDPGYVRLLLRRRVLVALVEHELALRGVAISDVCRQAAQSGMAAALSGDAAEGAAFLAAFPPAYVTQLETWNAEVKQLGATLSGLPCGTTDPNAQNRIGTAYSTWQDAALPVAQIAIDPAYGTWDSATATIAPPQGAAGTTTTSTGS